MACTAAEAAIDAAADRRRGLDEDVAIPGAESVVDGSRVLIWNAAGVPDVMTG